MGGSCRDTQLFRVLSDTLISWSAGDTMEQLWPKAVHHQIRAKATVGRDQMGGREIVGRSISK